jgi:hypothetical protein
MANARSRTSLSFIAEAPDIGASNCHPACRSARLSHDHRQGEYGELVAIDYRFHDTPRTDAVAIGYARLVQAAGLAWWFLLRARLAEAKATPHVCFRPDAQARGHTAPVERNRTKQISSLAMQS